MKNEIGQFQNVISNFSANGNNNIVKKGKNAHTKNTPKNASVAQYHAATGLEALFGYLYLKGKIERIRELFNFISPNNFIDIIKS